MAKARFDKTRRPIETSIDWNAVGNQVVSELEGAKQFREQKKAELEKISVEYGNTLADAPSGDYKDANQFALDHANNASEMLMINNRLLKQGLLSPIEYKKRMQNLTDGTSRLFDVAKKYQETYSDYLERTKTGANQQLEVYMREKLGKFADLKNVNTFINPDTNAISVGQITEKDGVMGMSDRVAAHVTINQLGAINSQKFDKYNLAENLDAEVKRLGSYVDQVLKSDQSVEEISDPTLKKKFEDMENNMISAILKNPYSQSSILTESLRINPKTGKEYEIVEEIPEGGDRDDFILLNIDGSGRPVLEFTDQQNEDAREAIRTKFRTMIDEKRRIVKAAPKPTKAEIDAAAAGKAKERVATSWNDIYYAPTSEDKNELVSSILSDDLSIEKGIIDIKFTDDGRSLSVEYLIPEKNRTGDKKIRIPENPTPEQWARIGAEIHGISDTKKAIAAGGGFPKDATYVNDFEGVGAARAGIAESTEVDYITEAVRDINNIASENINLVDDAKDHESIPVLQSVFGDYGFTFENTDRYGNDVTVIAPDKSTHTFNTNNENDEAAGVMDSLAGWMRSRITKENAENAYKIRGISKRGELD